MNAASLALAAVRSRPLHSALSMTAAAAGVALLCAIFLLSQAIDEGLSRNARGIDVIAGAKGSPIQLVLSAIYHADVPTRTIEDYIKDYVDVPPGATDWKVFGKTRQIEIRGKTPDGYDLEYYKPEFTPDVTALDGKQITVKGFMFPLDETEAQKLFLFGPFPVNCPFQYHVGPSLVMEVHSDKHPVKFSYDPIVVTGTLKLVAEDPDNNIFYRLMDAKQVNP